MPKGIKMTSAYDGARRLHHVDAMPRGIDLFCTGCLASLTFVDTYPRYGRTDHAISVSAHPRLSGGRSHAEDCANSTHRQVEFLAAKGVALERKAPPNDGRYEFRLATLDRPSSERQLHEQPSADTRSRVSVQQSEAYLAPYFRTATGLARIAALVESAPELRNLVTIRHKGRAIPWSKFFFGDEQLHRLVTWLGRRVLGKPTHPVAAIVRPRKLEDGRPGQPRRMRCFAEQATLTDTKMVIVPRVFGPLAATLEVGADYIAFGNWFLGSGESEFANLNLIVDHPGQLLKLQA